MKTLILKRVFVLKIIVSWLSNLISLKLLFKFSLIAWATLAFPCHAAAANETLEDEVKAAYLYKFSSYVDWPSGAFDSANSPFKLCVLGGNERFNATLKKIVQGESVNGRTIEVNQVNTLEKDPGCHILYIGIIDPQQSAVLIDSVRGSNVLTVSDNAYQGIIGFTITNNRLRFNINDAAAAENGLIISSRLLKLAVNVKKRG